MELETVRAGDLCVAYRWDGPKDGPLIMMAHALGTDHRIWDWQIAALADRYRILRYDWRGHGQTDAPAGPYSLEQLARDAVDLMTALDLPPVHWVGLSAGGMIGLGLALDHATRLSSLTLCNTSSQTDAAYRAFAAERQNILANDGMEAIWTLTERLWFTDAFVSAAGSDYQTVRDIYVGTAASGYLGATAAVADLAYRDRLGEIRLPTRIIAAGDDTVTPISRSQEMADRIPEATLTVLDGVRHFSNVEAPARFNAALCAALDDLTAIGATER